MDKEVVVRIYNGILLSHRKGRSLSVELRQMNLEPIIPTEVSQKEKKIVLINAYMWNVGK